MTKKTKIKKDPNLDLLVEIIAYEARINPRALQDLKNTSSSEEYGYYLNHLSDLSFSWKFNKT